MIYFLKNIQELSSSSISLKHGDEVVLADPDVRFFLSEEANKLSMRTGPVRSDAVLKAIAVAFEKFIGRRLQDLPDFVGPTEPVFLMEMTIPSVENDTKQVEFDCTRTCPVSPGRKHCHKTIKHTTDPVTGHVWEEIFMPCGHIRHDQTAFYEQMKKTMANSKNVNFDACIDLNPEVLQPSTEGSKQLSQCNDRSYGIRHEQQELKFQCTSQHLHCPNRRGRSEVTCTAAVAITIPPSDVPWLICKMPCGSYFDYSSADERIELDARLRDLSLKTGFNRETVQDLLEKLIQSGFAVWQPKYQGDTK